MFEPPTEIILPENFSSIILDFVGDLTITFPEYASLWSEYHKDTDEKTWIKLYEYCLTVYPERFFDILYQNIDIFSTKEINTMFLPNVEFKLLFRCEGISENTRTSIWKYIQLIMFTIIGSVKDKNDFGKSMNLFEGIDEQELQSKLTEAMGNIGDFFQTMGNKSEFFQNMFPHENEKNEKNEKNEDEENKKGGIPTPDDLHNHLKGLFGGKLGNLAKELMEELTEDLHETLGLNPEDFNESSDPKEVFSKLMRHPDKFMKIVQKINQKFQEKMKSGDLSKEDIMKEAGEMLQKMKEMGGNTSQMNEMFQNMAKTMGGMGGQKNTKVDTNTMNRMSKMQTAKDRMKAKLEKKKDNFLLQQTSEQTFTYRPLNGEPALKSIVKQDMTSAELDALVAEIEGKSCATKSDATKSDATKSDDKKKKNKKKTK
jgi:hypothetical protein